MCLTETNDISSLAEQAWERQNLSRRSHNPPVLNTNGPLNDGPLNIEEKPAPAGEGGQRGTAIHLEPERQGTTSPVFSVHTSGDSSFSDTTGRK